MNLHIQQAEAAAKRQTIRRSERDPQPTGARSQIGLDYVGFRSLYLQVNMENNAAEAKKLCWMQPEPFQMLIIMLKNMT